MVFLFLFSLGIQKLTEKLGERPSAKQYAKEYGSFQSVITVYGTWNKALDMAGIETYTKEITQLSAMAKS